METPLPLVDRLHACAQQWVAANDASLARLGRTVLNDGGFFSRTSDPGASTTTATLEKFARFLIDPGQWPAAHVPPLVSEFAQVVGISSVPCAASPDSDDEIIPEAAE